MLTRYAGAAVVATMIAATMATGITYAATTSHGAKACVSHAGVLSLLRDGTCAPGSHRVTLGARGPRGRAATKYWAEVSATGHVSHGSPGVTAVESVEGSTDVFYEVTFPHSVARCAALATLAENPNGSVSPGEIDASIHGKEVEVVDFSTSPGSGTASTGFSVAVLC